VSLALMAGRQFHWHKTFIMLMLLHFLLRDDDEEDAASSAIDMTMLQLLSFV